MASPDPQGRRLRCTKSRIEKGCCGLLAAGVAAAVALWFTPIFIANLVFAERFRNVEASNVAFGANLLGAMVGGVLEYVALLTGYQALIILVALLYGAAFLTGRVHLREGSRAAAAASTAST